MRNSRGTPSTATSPHHLLPFLSQSSSNEWAHLGTATTGTNGVYSLTVSIPTQDSYVIQAGFYGDISYTESYEWFGR